MMIMLMKKKWLLKPRFADINKVLNKCWQNDLAEPWKKWCSTWFFVPLLRNEFELFFLLKVLVMKSKLNQVRMISRPLAIINQLWKRLKNLVDTVFCVVWPKLSFLIFLKAMNFKFLIWNEIFNSPITK